ncbi:hypothetical protein FA95DRAFT_1357454 [Auriscalpium vulgare]|uniref:Uncharacterized protein n=1 Tax=Auriscalpium vulgare TaxID=40419 RepID=A0ACB8R2S7_9AGAM|nr:hypothetical protein FA95DRAFT_1357454 [Auriscalpium vulgare]
MSFLKPKQSVGVRKSSANLETNERMCFSVLTSCVRYGERAVAACAKILQMRPYARVADVDELRERAREVRAWRIDEAAFSTNAGTPSCISIWTLLNYSAGDKAYGRVLAKAKAVLHDVDRSFRSLLTRKNTAFAMLASAKEPDLHLSVAQLGRRLRSCKAEHDAFAAGLRVVSAMVVDLVVD